jgi:hypothetical protein
MTSGRQFTEPAESSDSRIAIRAGCAPDRRDESTYSLELRTRFATAREPIGKCTRDPLDIALHAFTAKPSGSLPTPGRLSSTFPGEVRPTVTSPLPTIRATSPRSSAVNPCSQRHGATPAHLQGSLVTFSQPVGEFRRGWTGAETGLVSRDCDAARRHSSRKSARCVIPDAYPKGDGRTPISRVSGSIGECPIGLRP